MRALIGIFDVISTLNLDQLNFECVFGFSIVPAAVVSIVYDMAWPIMLIVAYLFYITIKPYCAWVYSAARKMLGGPSLKASRTKVADGEAAASELEAAPAADDSIPRSSSRAVATERRRLPKGELPEWRLPAFQACCCVALTIREVHMYQSHNDKTRNGILEIWGMADFAIIALVLLIPISLNICEHSILISLGYWHDGQRRPLVVTLGALGGTVLLVLILGAYPDEMTVYSQIPMRHDGWAIADQSVDWIIGIAHVTLAWIQRIGLRPCLSFKKGTCKANFISIALSIGLWLLVLLIIRRLSFPQHGNGRSFPQAGHVLHR